VENRTASRNFTIAASNTCCCSASARDHFEKRTTAKRGRSSGCRPRSISTAKLEAGGHEYPDRSRRRASDSAKATSSTRREKADVIGATA